MASYDITAEVNEMLTLGVPETAIVAAGRVSHLGATWSADNRGTHYAIQNMLAEARRTATAVKVAVPTATTTRPATSRQVEYIRALGGDVPADLTADQASGVIESLKARRAAASHSVHGEIWDN